MIQQRLHEITVETRGRGFYEITQDVARWLAAARVKDGLVTLHVRHTSASLVIQENADPEVRRDFERFMSRLVPDGDPMFRHVAEGEDDMPAHVRSAFTAVNVSIPVQRGRMVLGTWQGIYLWEHRTHPHTRQIAAHWLGESD